MFSELEFHEISKRKHRKTRCFIQNQHIILTWKTVKIHGKIRCFLTFYVENTVKCEVFCNLCDFGAQRGVNRVSKRWLFQWGAPGGSPEAILTPFGVSFGTSLEPLGVLSGPLGGSFWGYWAQFGCNFGFMGPSRTSFSHLWGLRDVF